MTGARTARLVMAAALALGIAGCQDPYQREPAQKRSPTATPAPGDVERPGPRAPSLRIAPETPAGGARAVARAFASGWVNWDWRTLPARQRGLARLAAGRAAAQTRDTPPANDPNA